MNVESSASVPDADNPWPGLAPFTEAQSAQFFGRDAEIKTLSRRVQGDPLTVLFGQSGLGKSSLLQAGVFPRLRSADHCPVYIRLDHAPDAPALGEQVKQVVLTEAARAGKWTKPGFARPGESLWEFFHHRDNRLVSPGGIALSPVLVFDQFEELFTLGGGARSTGSASEAGGTARQRAVAFMTELAELVENRPPEALVARVEESAAELDAFDFGATDYRVVITLREDYLPDLESLKTIMPALMDNRMRLTRMNGVQALEAVVKPGAGLVSESVAREIVEFVAGARGGSAERLAELDVEPPLLSIICRELNERRRALGHAQITTDLVTGNRREILTGFYERSVADLPERMRTFVEDHLLTKSGFRDNLSLESALDHPGVTRPLIDTLVNRRLLRIEDRLGVERVELTHDVLAEVIRNSRDAHHQQVALEQAQAVERVTRRRMWLARTIAAALLVVLAGVSWVAWRAIHAEREQTRLRSDADLARMREAALRTQAEAHELSAKRMAYASDMNGVQSALAADNLGRARELLNRHRPKRGEQDPRGWEWRYLWQFCQSDARAVIKPETDNSVTSLAASPDGEWIAVGGYFGGSLSIVNTRTKEEIRLPAGSSRVLVAFSQREPLLAYYAAGADANTPVAQDAELRAASAGFRVHLYDLNTRQVLRELPLSGPCHGLVFAADGRTLVAVDFGSNGVTLSRWRVPDGQNLARYTVPSGGPASLSHSLAVTPDASLALIGSAGGGATVVDLRTGVQERVLAAETGGSSVALTPDGALAATSKLESGAIPTIRIWEVATGREMASLLGHRGRIDQLMFLQNGRQLLSASADQTLRLWDLDKRTVVRTFRGHKTEVWRFALLPDQRTIVSGSKDGSVYVWDLQSARENTAAGVLDVQRSAAWTFAEGGRAIVYLAPDGHLTRRQGPGFQEVVPLCKTEAMADRGGFSFSGNRILAAFDAKRSCVALLTHTGGLQVWDWERGALLREIPGVDPSGNVSLQLILREGGRVGLKYHLERDRIAYREWEIATGRELQSRTFAVAPTTRLSEAFSSDGGRFVHFPYPSGHGQMFDLESGATTQLGMNLLEPSRSPAFSADGRLLAVPSLRSNLRLFDLRKNQEVAHLRGYMFGVHSATFSPDGRRVASGGTGNESIVLWDVENHQRLLVLPTVENLITTVDFSPDGNVLAGYNFGRRLYLWRAPTWAEIENVEAAETATQ